MIVNKSDGNLENILKKTITDDEKQEIIFLFRLLKPITVLNQNKSHH